MKDANYKSCIAACSESALAAKRCAGADLTEDHASAMTRCISLNHDCAAICVLAIEAMTGKSEFVKQICALCIEICEACAVECNYHSDMDHCKKCAAACRESIAECKKIVNQ